MKERLDRVTRADACKILKLIGQKNPAFVRAPCAQAIPPSFSPFRPCRHCEMNPRYNFSPDVQSTLIFAIAEKRGPTDSAIIASVVNNWLGKFIL